MNKSVLMRDGVARPICLSLIVHLLSLGLLVFTPKPSSSSPPLVSYPVSLVSLKSPKQEPIGVETTSLTPPPPVSPAPQKQDMPEAAAVPPPTTPVTRVDPAPTLSLPNVVPVEAPSQEASALPVAPSVKPPSDPTIPPYLAPSEGPIETQTASVPRFLRTIPVPTFSIKGEGSLGTAGGPLLNHPYYFEGIQGKISANWAPPSEIFSSGPQGDIAVVIGFVVQQNGQIRRGSVILEKGSGNPFLDASALRAVYNANPLLPLPKGITEELHVHFEFTVRPQS